MKKLGKYHVGYDVHHKNWNSLDNRPVNLEMSSPSVNRATSHYFK